MEKPHQSLLSLMGILSLKLNVSSGTACGKVTSVNIWSDGPATIAPKICGCLNLSYIMHRGLYMNTWVPCEYVRPKARSLALFWHGGVLASAASQLSNSSFGSCLKLPMGEASPAASFLGELPPGEALPTAALAQCYNAKPWYLVIPKAL